MEKTKATLIDIANKICMRNFMDYSDYDEDNPITTLAEALAVFVQEGMPHGLEIESSEVYDLLKEKLS